MRKLIIIFVLFSSCVNIWAQVSEQETAKKLYLKQQQAWHLIDNNNNLAAYDILVDAISLIDSIGFRQTPFSAALREDAALCIFKAKKAIGEFTKLMNESIDISIKTGCDSTDLFNQFKTLGDGLLSYGRSLDFPHNISYINQAISSYKNDPSFEKNRNYRSAISDLAVIYNKIDLNKSILLSHSLLDLERNNPIGYDTLIVYSTLSANYNEYGEYERALKLIKKVIEERQKTKDLKSLRVAYHRISSIYARSGHIEDAILYSKKAVSLAKLTEGPLSKQYAINLNNLGVYYLLNHDYRQAINCYKESCKIDNQTLPYSNLAVCYENINKLDSCAFYLNRHCQYNWNEIVKNFSLLSHSDKVNYSSTEKTLGVVNIPFNFLRMHPEYGEFSKLAYNSLLNFKNILYKFNNDQHAHSEEYNSDYIRTFLDDNEIAIEVKEISDFDSDSIFTYALLLRKDWVSPKVVFLDKVYPTFFNEYKTTDTYLPMYENVWKDIIKQGNIKENEHIYISLDGLLEQLPIESICGYDWKYMDEKYDIFRVSSTKQIYNIKKEKKLENAIVYGGLEYKVKFNDSINIENSYPLKFLPWSKIECEYVYKKLKSCGINTVCLESTKGNIESFKNLSNNSPSIIHVASHGIYPYTENEFNSIEEQIQFYMHNSGLMFSPSNKDEIGFLSSENISKLNLGNTSLVVLSCCKTGYGSDTHYGLTGLIQGFKSAGAQTIIMTLGDVDDAASFYFMKIFYDALSEGLSKREAFKIAKQRLRESTKFHDFKFWSNFIMID